MTKVDVRKRLDEALVVLWHAAATPLVSRVVLDNAATQVAVAVQLRIQCLDDVRLKAERAQLK